jgi:hypothetical protein
LQVAENAKPGPCVGASLIFLAGEAGAALVGGGSASAMKNSNGVIMQLKSSQEGVRLTFAAEGLRFKLK